MVDVECMTVVLIPACVYGGLERRVWEKNKGASFRKQRCFLIASGGAVQLREDCLRLSVNAFCFYFSLLMMSLDVRWLLCNIHFHT